MALVGGVFDRPHLHILFRNARNILATGPEAAGYRSMDVNQYLRGVRLNHTPFLSISPAIAPEGYLRERDCGTEKISNEISGNVLSCGGG